MCGRFRLTRASKLAERFGIEAEDDWVPRYNIAPTQNVEVIRHHQEEPKRFGSQMRWGLIPFWAKDASSGIINARAETIASKFSFRDALKKRRCLIPADGFYEWKKDGKVKTPFCFTMADDSIFAFAGLWETWRNPAGNSSRRAPSSPARRTLCCRMSTTACTSSCPMMFTTCGLTPACKRRTRCATC